MVVAYHITYDGNPDSYPLHIAAKVLSDGESSRIYKKLVYDKQMAVAAFGQAMERKPLALVSPVGSAALTAMLQQKLLDKADVVVVLMLGPPGAEKWPKLSSSYR